MGPMASIDLGPSAFFPLFAGFLFLGWLIPRLIQRMIKRLIEAQRRRGQDRLDRLWNWPTSPHVGEPGSSYQARPRGKLGQSTSREPRGTGLWPMRRRGG
jgi:hypothetical protein